MEKGIPSRIFWKDNLLLVIQNTLNEYLQRGDGMKKTMEELNQLLEKLTEQSKQLGERMHQSALQLQNDGIIPEQMLINEIQSFQQQLQEMNQLLTQESGAENPSENPPEEPLSLETLRATIEQLQVLQRANEVLDEITLIIHCDNDKFLPLQECQTVAALLKENIQGSSETHPEIQTVLDGKHPLCALLALVKTPDDLDDEMWSQHNESLTVAFGRQLATAVARGKLKMRLADDSQEETTPEETTEKRLQPQETK